uniref:Uncharacterized protein n=1 Tax=Plectus sambesii TaxID=2011161 RepID=A0A914X133_9BILA
MGRFVIPLILLLLVQVLLVQVRAELVRDEFSPDSETKRIIKKVFSTWSKDKKVTVIEDQDDANAKERAKARYLPLEDQWRPAERASCSLPGYTGELCQFPICNTTNTNVPNIPVVTGDGALIDMNHQMTCGTPYTTHIDSSLPSYILFEIQTGGNANPSLIIYNADGIQMNPSESGSYTALYTALFAYLPPGAYTIEPQSANPSLGCIIFVAARTNMTVSAGWVRTADFGQPERYDYPTVDAYRNAANTFISHINNLRFPGQQSQITIYEDANVLSRHPLSLRYGCGYEQYFQSFYCSFTGDYFYLIEGYDFYGYTFRRVNTFQCILNPSASTSPSQSTIATTPAGGLKCRNDGVLLNATDGSQYCYCQPFFTGVDCGAILCANGGTPLGTGLNCQCPVGFQGVNCADVVCDPPGSNGWRIDRPRIMFVIRTRYTMIDMIQPIIDSINGLAALYSFDPGYLGRYGLVLFNNNQLSLVESYASLSDMIVDLRKAQLNPGMDGGCTDSVLTALSAAFAIIDANKSPIYVFTDALANDNQLEDTITQRNSLWRSPVYFVYVTPLASSGCSLDPFDNGYRAFNRIAVRTAGHVFDIPDRSKTGELFYQHAVNTIYRANLVATNDPAQCANQPQFQPIMVDTKLAQLCITATGPQLSITIMNPNGIAVTPDTTYSLNFTYIWTISNPVAGQWFINIQSGAPTSACNYRILAINVLNSATDYDFFWATTPFITVDGIGPSPIYKQSAPLVGHINNYKLSDPTKVFAETTIYANDEQGNRQAVYFSNGIWRDGCTFQLFFGPFTCQRANQVLYMTVFVRDDVGFMIQRTSMMYCAATAPTFFPPSTCQNGGVQTTDPNNSTIRFCLCQPFYTGSLCQNTICVNGGSDIGGTCECPPGHTGLHCEITSCISPSNATTYGPNQKQIAFVLEMTQNSVGGLHYLNYYISTLIRDFQSQHPRWLTTYIVAGYNSTYAQILTTATADNVSSVTDAIGNAYNWTVANMDASCNVQFWQALSLVTSQMNSDGIIFVFHASVPDQGSGVLIPYVTNVYSAVLDRKMQINVLFGLGQGKYPCNSNSSAFDLMFEVTALSNGLVYETQLANWVNIIRIIPNYYESGIVYENFYFDCASQMRTFFVPVDSLTQTLQISTFGYQSNVTILLPNGSVFGDSYDLVADSVTGLRITEVRRACDDGWQPMGSYCIRWILTPTLNWTDAQGFCAASGGFLVDDMTQDTDIFLETRSSGIDFWLGLNDIQQEGSFVWDRPAGSPSAPLGTSFLNWAPGNPANDTQHEINCVSRRHSPVGTPGKWYNDRCALKYSFACQKHKYNQNVTAGAIFENDLRPGMWQVQVQTQPAQSQPSGCFVQIRSQSSIQVYPGYVQSDHSDQPDNEPLLGSTSNQIIAATTGLIGQNPGYLQYAHIYGTNLTMQRSATYEWRAGCNYPFLSQPWSCPGENGKASSFQVMHVGVDQQGYMFQRLTPGRCIPNVNTCNNGGVMYQGVCICQPLWTGKNCGIPVCLNGGSLSADNTTCICPTGYGGHACQYPVCLPQIPQSFSFDGKSLVLVVETTVQNIATLARMRDFLPGWLNSINTQQPSWFTNFILLTFDSSKTNAPIVTTTVNDFVAAFNTSSQAITDFSSNCSQPLFTALTAALQVPLLVVPGSVVWVITKGNPSDLNRETDAFLAIASTRALVNFLVVDDGFRPCGLDPNSANVAPMVDTAVASGGNAFFLPVATFTTHLSVYMPTLYQSSLLDMSLNRTCPAGTKWYAQVDAKMTQVVIDTYAYYAQISVTDPTGKPVVTNDLYSSPMNRLLMFSTEGNLAGIYTIAVSSQAPTCIVQVRGSSPLQMFVGYTQATSGNGQNQDDSYYSPIANVNTNLLLVHMNGITNHRIARLTYVEMVSPRANLSVSPIMPRANCSYEYYSNTFKCPDTAFLVAVHGTDEFGQNFRRFVITFCVTSRPTTSAQPQTTATTGGVVTTPTTVPGQTTTITGPSQSPYAVLNLDLVIAIDASATMPMANFDEVVTFLKSVLIPYTIGQGNPGTRVSIIDVPGDNGFLVPSNTLQSIANRASLLQALDNANQFYDGSTGQQFVALLQEVIRPEFSRSGYRADITNHLLLYITGTSTFTDDTDGTTAAAFAQTIRSHKTYGIIIIAYKAATVDVNALQTIAGGADCVLQATTIDQLNQQGIPLIQSKTLAGQYCGM